MPSIMTNDEYIALLRAADIPPRRIWDSNTVDKYEALREAIHGIVGPGCEGDDHWQDFHFYAEIRLPLNTLARPIKQHSKLPIGSGDEHARATILLSIWGDFAVLCSEDYMLPELRDKIILAIESCGLVYIPEHILDLPYDGPFEVDDPTWGSRYFGFQVVAH